MRVLGIVPARGGSKGIPRKNLCRLGGKPLLQYTAEAALKARRLSKVILTTEDAEIAEVGRSCGLEVPFLRPAELARDDTPTLSVVQHVMQEIEQAGEYYDAICLLQPTTPFRRAEQIDECIELLQHENADAVITVLQVPMKYNPQWVYWKDRNGHLILCTGSKEPITRRQDLPPAYHRDGSVYVTRRDVIMRHNSLYGERLCGYLLSPDDSVNIDGPVDLQHAQELIARRTLAGTQADNAMPVESLS
jgi:CMP-N-acetylneuraminic acid synthetase